MSSIRHLVLERIAAVMETITVANGYSVDVAHVSRRVSPIGTHSVFPAIFIGEPPEEKLEGISQGRTHVLLPIRFEAWNEDDLENSETDLTRLLRDMEWAILNDPTMGGIAVDVELLGNESAIVEHPPLIGVALDVLVHIRHDRDSTESPSPGPLPVIPVPGAQLSPSRREEVLDDLVATVNAIGIDASRRISVRHLVLPAVTVPEPSETKRISPLGVYEVLATIPVRVWVDDNLEEPNARLDSYVTQVENAILADRRRGGIAINTKVSATASEVTSVTDKLTTVLHVEVTYRHSANDPTSMLVSV